MANDSKKEHLVPAKDVNADILLPRLLFIVTTIALLLFGLVMIFSASNVEAINNNDNPFSYVMKQFGFCAFGILLAVVIWRGIPYSLWKTNFIWLLLVGLFVLMIMTLVGGKDILGARRWLYLGPLSFQPSEYAKVVLILVVARYYAEYRIGHISAWKLIVFGGLVTIAMLAFILCAQSDLGTTVICVVGVLALLLIAGIPMWQFLLLAGICVFVGFFAIATTGYRSNRMVFLDPYNDGANGFGAGYQLIRSYYAFAEGGFFGVGLGNSYEKYQYLPEAETDFIFAIIGEELGLFGCICLLVLFAVFICSGLIIALRSKSRFAGSVSGAFVTMIGFQVMLNIFCVIGFFPITGKPLPFISSGGSSVVACLVMVGFVLAGSEADALPDKYEKRRSKFSIGIPSEIFKKKEKQNYEQNPETNIQITQSKSRTKKPNISTSKKTGAINYKPDITSRLVSYDKTYKSKKQDSYLGFKPRESSIKRTSDRQTTVNKSRNNRRLSRRK